MLPIELSHIDHQLGIAYKLGDWPVYATVWWMAGQEEGSSKYFRPQDAANFSGLQFVLVPPADADG